MHKPLKTLVNAAVLSIMATNAAHAAGFALYGESNGAAIGNYGAGLAAEGADASIGWYNPAGLVLIHEQQAVFGGVGVFPHSSISGTSTFTTPTVPAYTQTFSDITSAENGFVPSFHYALPLGPKATFGFSVTSPFGLATNWKPDSPVRYAATYTEVLTTNFSPELGVLLTDNFSFGAGLDLQWSRVKFNTMLGVPTITGLPFIANNPMAIDSLSYNKGHSWGVGFHAGVLGMFNQNHTRVGLNYQSQMSHKFYGFSRLTGNMANPDTNIFFQPSYSNGEFLSNDLFSNNISYPDVVTLSGYQDVNDKLALLGSVIFTHWNVFQTINLNEIAASTITLPAGFATPVLVNNSVPEYYSNAWRAAVGANYYFNEKLMLRVGGGYDGTPTNDQYRDVRLPDGSRWALAIGGRYFVSPNISVDAGYQHLFGISNNGVNEFEQLGPTTTYEVQADASNSADLVGLQLNWTIDKIPEVPTK